MREHKGGVNTCSFCGRKNSEGASYTYHANLFVCETCAVEKLPEFIGFAYAYDGCGAFGYFTDALEKVVQGYWRGVAMAQTHQRYAAINRISVMEMEIEGDVEE